MNSEIAKIYKLPLLISLTLAIALISITVAKTSYQIAYLALGAIAGTFLLDIDYFIHAYIFEPTIEFSKNLKLYIKDKDIKNAILYFNHNKNVAKEKTLNSVIFQISLMVLAYFVITASRNYFMKAFVLSAYVNSMYRYAEIYYNRHNVDEWFWILKDKPTKEGLQMYGAALIATLIFFLAIF